MAERAFPGVGTAGALILAAVVSQSCTASFPAQPSTPAALTELVVQYPLGGSRMVAGAIGVVDGPAVFRAYTVDADGVYADVSDRVGWSSSNPQALRFNFGANGAGQMLQPGIVDLFAAYQGLVGTLRVAVRGRPPYPFLEIQGSSPPRIVTLVKGPTFNSFDRQDATRLVTWSSSDETVATVNSSGEIFGRRAGNVEIRASLDGMTDSLWVSIPPRR